jgi:hypothetical protein
VELTPTAPFGYIKITTVNTKLENVVDSTNKEIEYVNQVMLNKDPVTPELSDVQALKIFAMNHLPISKTFRFFFIPLP